jgi:hypothetical protein
LISLECKPEPLLYKQRLPTIVGIVCFRVDNSLFYLLPCWCDIEWGSVTLTTRPRVEHFEPIMIRMERQPTYISSLLTHAGRLKLVNSVLSASPTYTMFQFLSLSMITLIESGGIVCGESQTSTPDQSP